MGPSSGFATTVSRRTKSLTGISGLWLVSDFISDFWNFRFQKTDEQNVVRGWQDMVKSGNIVCSLIAV
jgi:hypothetical protein